MPEAPMTAYSPACTEVALPKSLVRPMGSCFLMPKARALWRISRASPLPAIRKERRGGIAYPQELRGPVLAPVPKRELALGTNET